jgi:hypothetical protein
MKTKNRQRTELVKLANELDEWIRGRLAMYGIARPNLVDDLGADLQSALEDESLADAFRLRARFRDLIGKLKP